MKCLITILFLFLYSSVFSQSIVMDNKSTEDIEASYRMAKPSDSFNFLSKGKSKTEGFSNVSELKGILFWKYDKSEEIEKFEYDIKILGEKFDEIHFVYLGEKQWCVRIFKNKKYTPEFQIVVKKDKQELIPLETQYTFSNKNETVLLMGILVDSFEILYIGRANSSLLGHTIYFSRPNKEKKYTYKISSNKKEYEDIVIDLKEVDMSNVNRFDATINGNELELIVFKSLPNYEEKQIYSKKFDLKEKEVQVKKNDEEKK